MKNVINSVPVIMQMEAVECGAASLDMILAYYGKWVPLEEVRSECGVSRDGANSSNILKAARRYGLEAKGKAMGLSALKEKRPFPCIIHWNFYHFVVLTGIRGKHAYLNDPGAGKVKVPLEQFEKAYTGIAMVFSPGESFARGGGKPNPWNFAFSRAKKMKSGLVVILLSAMVATIAGIGITAIGRLFLDYYLPGKFQNYGIMLLILFLLVLVFFAMRAVTQIRMMKLQGRSSVIESSRFMNHMLRLPMVFYGQRTIGDLLLRQRENEDITLILLNQIAPVAVDLIMLVFYVIIMITYSPLLACIGIASALINAFAAVIISKKRIDVTRSMTRESGQLYAATVGGLDMIETLKSSGAESGFFRRWAGYQAAVTENKAKLTGINEKLGLIPAAFVEIANILVFGLGMFLIIRGNFSAGMLLTFTGLLQAFMNPVNRIIGLGQTIQEMQVKMERVDDVMKYPEDPESDVKLSEEEWQNIRKLSGNIEMKNVTFGYSALADPLIENFNLSVKAGESIALVGASGSGKSTIGKVLSGLYQPWGGEILFDGKKIDEIPKQQFRGSLAVVDQDICVFEDTIKNNISLWDASTENFDVQLASKDACIYDEIAARKGNFSALIESGGRNFSGGQLQRLEIARVMALDPTILILDEATSALDAETEDEVMRNIRKRGITCIIVAHRLSTIRDCDRILVLKDGKIVEQGTHDELMAKDGYYSILIKSE